MFLDIAGGTDDLDTCENGTSTCTTSIQSNLKSAFQISWKKKVPSTNASVQSEQPFEEEGSFYANLLPERIHFRLRSYEGSVSITPVDGKGHREVALLLKRRVSAGRRSSLTVVPPVQLVH